LSVNNSTYTYTIAPSANRYAQTVEIGGTAYSSYFACRNDTFYFYKFNSPSYTVAGNDTSSVGFYGTCKIPLKLNIGDSLPFFTDMTWSGYNHAEMGDAVKTHSYISGNYLISHSELHTALVKSTVGLYNYYINNMNAVVTGKEKITVAGKTYDAFKIQSEIWTKSSVQVDASSDDVVVNKKYKKGAKKANKKMDKNIRALADNNLGYMVTPVEQWFVPQLGFVKTLMYNNDKTLITVKSEIISIQY
jgi:hypothetical protein